MGSPFATVAAVIDRARGAWRPPPKLTLSEWADRYFYLSAESSAQVGRWTTIPYQRGIMDAMTDATIEEVWVQKSARVGWTKIINAFVGFSVHQDPCPIGVVQPTVDDAKGYSKDEIAPMLRDCPALAKVVFEDVEEETGPKGSGNTILHKKFPGGVIGFIGANSGTGFRRVSRKRMLLDEIDAYPPSAGSDGDPISLAKKRTEYYWDRKIAGGSTPLIKGRSKIEKRFLSGDRRRYYVPCPHCGHFDHLVFTKRDGGGHYMVWPEGKPEEAHFVCSLNGCVIEHQHKRQMVERGEWRATPPCPEGCAVEHEHVAPFHGVASFHIWAAYSYSPNATWGQIAKEWADAAKAGPEELQTAVNTLLGETWQEAGEAPDWERLFERRDDYPIGTVPAGVLGVTCGVDVQKDRWVYEVVGWGAGKQSWSIQAGEIAGDTSLSSEWTKLDELLGRSFIDANGVAWAIRLMAIDSGYNTQMVYDWARHHVGRVIATKGVSGQRTLTVPPTPVDVKINGKRIARGCKVWPVGVDIAKAELYGWLRAKKSDPPPPGWCHFPQYSDGFFKQLTGEQLVSTRDKRGFVQREWQLIPGRENHHLDARIGARVAAAQIGLDLMAPPQSAPVAQPQAPVTPNGAVRPAPPPRPVAPPPKKSTDSRFLSHPNRGSWLKRR